VSSPDIAKQTEVEFGVQHVHFTNPHCNVSFALSLANEIIPEQSLKAEGSKKIELKLKKAVERANWMSLEKGGQTVLMATAGPSQN
jgi:hypothetical protein